MKEKKKKRKGMRYTPVGELKERRGYHIWGGPFTGSKIHKNRRGDDLYYSPICPSLRQVSSSAGGDWMQKSRVRRAGLQRGLLLAEWR